MEVLVKELEINQDYNVYSTFRNIDKFNEGFIHMENLQNWFRSFGNYLVESELHAIIRRIDLDGDGKISFKEFADFFDTQISESTYLIKPPINKEEKKNLNPSAAKA